MMFRIITRIIIPSSWNLWDWKASQSLSTFDPEISIPSIPKIAAPSQAANKSAFRDGRTLPREPRPGRQSPGKSRPRVNGYGKKLHKLGGWERSHSTHVTYVYIYIYIHPYIYICKYIVHSLCKIYIYIDIDIDLDIDVCVHTCQYITHVY